MYPNPPISDPEWIHTARHEAGHALAKLLASRAFYQNDYAFDSIRIRPSARGPHKDRRGRRCDCLGCVQGAGFYNATGFPEGNLITEEYRHAAMLRAEWQIVIDLAGPFAAAASLGVTSKRSMPATALFSGGCDSDYECADRVFKELNTMAGRRTSWKNLEYRTRDIVLEYWQAIQALADALMVKHRVGCESAVAIMLPYLGQSRMAA